jgi:hypothetical protein
MRQVSRLTAAKLQGQRVFFGVKAQMTRHITMQQSARGDHLGVKQSVWREQPVQVATMAVCPIHHGGYGESVHHRKGILAVNVLRLGRTDWPGPWHWRYSRAGLESFFTK